ncbi:MAG: DUF6483 family protein [Gemmatimonadaceae bacterium]
MPVREDYMLRMIRQLGAALSRVGELLRIRRPSEARAELRRAARGIGLDLDLLASLADDSLLALLGGPAALDVARAAAVAEILRLEGEVRGAEGRSAERADCLRKSLHLYLAASAANPAATGPESNAMIATLATTLGRAALPADLLEQLVGHYERVGRYDSAEDTLFELARVRGDRALALGAAFYGALLARTDDALEVGGLPRDEAEQGLHALREHAAGTAPDALGD